MHQFWSARRVLVTGATGFLGAWLVRELRHRGAFVVGLMRDRPAEPLLSDARWRSLISPSSVSSRTMTACCAR